MKTVEPKFLFDKFYLASIIIYFHVSYVSQITETAHQIDCWLQISAVHDAS